MFSAFKFDLVVVQSLSCVRLLETPRTAARQASLSITISLSLLKLMSTESMIQSNHLILWLWDLAKKFLRKESNCFLWRIFFVGYPEIVQLFEAQMITAPVIPLTQPIIKYIRNKTISQDICMYEKTLYSQMTYYYLQKNNVQPALKFQEITISKLQILQHSYRRNN